jgi:hypothetical protein
MTELVDIEWLVGWAISQDRSLGWRRDGERELAFDRGLTVKPRKRPHVGWIEATASAGGSLKIAAGKGAVMAQSKPDPDALLVIAALNQLDPWTQSVITANAKRQRRPDWMEGIEPRLVPERSYAKKRKKRGRGQYRKSVVKMVWKPVSPEVICATREIYSRWHLGMTRLMAIVEGQLSSYRVNGLAAPSTPWEMPLQKIA